MGCKIMKAKVAGGSYYIALAGCVLVESNYIFQAAEMIMGQLHWKLKTFVTTNHSFYVLFFMSLLLGCSDAKIN